MFAHRQKDLNSPIGFSGGDVPLGDDRERLVARADPARPHSRDEGPDRPEVSETAGDVDRVVEGGRGVGVIGVVV